MAAGGPRRPPAAILCAAPQGAPGPGPQLLRGLPGGGGEAGQPPGGLPGMRGGNRGRSRVVEPGVLQALRGRGAVLRGVAQRCQEEAGQRGGLLPSPAVPVHQHGLQAARGEPGDPQESAWWGHEERGDVRSAEIRRAQRLNCASPEEPAAALRLTRLSRSSPPFCANLPA